MIGDRITVLVVPTMMVFTMSASAFDVGLTTTAQYIAYPVLGLVAGAVIDRWGRRWLMIACDLARVVTLAVIPVAYWCGWLTMPLLLLCGSRQCRHRVL